jgi:hypothetical protein
MEVGGIEEEKQQFCYCSSFMLMLNLDLSKVSSVLGDL